MYVVKQAWTGMTVAGAAERPEGRKGGRVERRRGGRTEAGSANPAHQAAHPRDERKQSDGGGTDPQGLMEEETGEVVGICR